MNGLPVAEYILEYFHDKSIKKPIKIWGLNAQNAVRLLVDMGLIELDGDRIILTKIGKKFINLPPQ